MTAPGARPIHTKKRRGFNPPPPKPCPICWRLMALVGGHHECEKHGKPTRA